MSQPVLYLQIGDDTDTDVQHANPLTDVLFIRSPSSSLSPELLVDIGGVVENYYFQNMNEFYKQLN